MHGTMQRVMQKELNDSRGHRIYVKYLQLKAPIPFRRKRQTHPTRNTSPRRIQRSNPILILFDHST